MKERVEATLFMTGTTRTSAELSGSRLKVVADMILNPPLKSSESTVRSVPAKPDMLDTDRIEGGE